MTYLGKRISVPIKERGQDCKFTGRMTTAAGVCEIEPQPNEILGIALMVTIDRMPIEINSLNDIRVL